MTSLNDHADSIPTDLPPSAKYVLSTLREFPGSTKKDLIEHTLLFPSTVKRALRKLEERCLVEQRPSPEDARQSEYYPTLEDSTETDGFGE